MEKTKIDLVYTWVNDNDSEWQKKKKKYEQIFFQNHDTTDALNVCRYINNNELMYSLRSVEKCVPWINHIFIITDHQMPEWLDLNNSKITIVDHTEIIPAEALPTFNSLSIEHCIKNITDLSENFLYANDDMFFYEKLSPSFFFDENGKTICRYHRKIKNKANDLYTDMVRNAHKLIFEKYHKKFNLYPFHGIDAYKKSEIKMCYEEFKEDIDKTIYSRFRDKENISRIIYSDYICAKGLGKFKRMTNYDTDLPIVKQIINILIRKYKRDLLDVQGPRACKIEKYIKRYNPRLLCLNDTEETTENDRELFKQFMAKAFADKSEFEK